MVKSTPRVTSPCNSDRGDARRKKLIEAGLKLYSEVGYEGASTRDLGAAAGTNIAAIPYYFGGKEGLYHGVIDHIVECFRRALGDKIEKIKQALRDTKITPAGRRALLDEYIETVLDFVLQESKERAQMSRIILREQLDPTSAFDRLYDGFVREMHETLAALIGPLLGSKTTPSETKLIAQMLLGQVTIFKSSRETTLRTMGWKNYGDKGITEIKRIVAFHIEAIMQAYKKS